MMNAATVAKTLTPAVNKVLVARATAQVLREEIDAIKARVLAEGDYTNQYTGERILTPKDDWMMADGTAYYAILEREVREAGHDVPPEFCPALMAETAQRDAEHELIEAARVFPEFEHMTTSRLLCGSKEKRGLELHAEYLDLLIKLVVNAPGYKRLSA